VARHEIPSGSRGALRPRPLKPARRVERRILDFVLAAFSKTVSYCQVLIARALLLGPAMAFITQVSNDKTLVEPRFHNYLAEGA
jgi:hypothetical protein